MKSIYHEEGREEGREEGKLEQAKIMAINAIQEGLTDSIIAKLTGLTLEAIQELRTEVS